MSGMLRVGRGGAGNFISQKDVQEAERKAQQANPQGPEAQRPPPSAPEYPPAPAVPEAPQYVRSGRGGAGNFADAPTIAESQDREAVVDRTKAAVTASQAGKPRTGLTGRGGAGNWTDNTPAARDSAGGTQAKEHEIEEQVAHDIEATLPPPPKTYHQHDRDMD
ncbi:hypothetical protein M406DRAFT_354219 [Cryphonectria parasitica EP155]|uniref:Uncharacterized protein n=1 Tax=Cryphonectria parasitica (strain ATCC 38755 / EP155) TaxID=660469 RepID=A0A9P4YBL2_CRYP1|nr:uncharacterized protein M406DRAFT_354219 [Cryphonectria parasitica EP155]KAF3770009.1 hypothetical protein M406DRAFT_354219 [Cryphonectria parasitica EP155]